jgi:alanyl-tRNA synthetase
MKWTREKLISEYLKFFQSKKHKVIPSASLVPANDPTVLFTTAGMHPLVPYLLGQKHPLGKRLVNVQKCIRTTDIDEVGDTTHHTFLEMMGNWSLGNYWKEEAIKMTFEFHTKILKIPLERYAVTAFSGNKDVKKDDESIKVWLSLGIPKERILLQDDNWWGPAGEVGPCGPDTEMFYWAPNNIPAPKKFVSEDKDVRWVEIGNDVLMEFIKEKSGRFIEAEQKNIDFGGGLERTLAVLNGLDDNYLTDLWQPIIKQIENLSGKKYKSNEKSMRIIADHIKASVFLIGEGVVPSNTGRGYVLRRLIRRAVRHYRKLGSHEAGDKFVTREIAKAVIKIYEKYYKELKENRSKIFSELEDEEKRFIKTLESGLSVFYKISPKEGKGDEISGEDAFLLYQSYGFPIEMTIELAREKGFSVDLKDFQQELKKHQELSRTTSSGSFKSGLADNSEKTTRLHTATHLLNEALRKVLGSEVKQCGSNITPERLRFDFNFSRKLTDGEIKSVEKLVNEKIKQELEVKRSETDLKDAIKSGAQAEFGMKYPEIVSVYFIGDFSKEICTGPHVKNTNEIGKFKIIKEESSAAGIRRIKAVVE